MSTSSCPKGIEGWLNIERRGSVRNESKVGGADLRSSGTQSEPTQSSLTQHCLNYPRHSQKKVHRRWVVVAILSWKKECFSASAGVILLSGLRARQRSNKS